MDLDKLPLFGLMNRRMAWLTQRQSVLAENISNADTPEYRPSDLTKASFRRMVEAGTNPAMLVKTSAGHMEPLRKPAAYRTEKERDPYETELSGNSVVLEEQLMKVSETQSAYRLATNLYRKHVAMLKAAIGYNR